MPQHGEISLRRGAPADGHLAAPVCFRSAARIEAVPTAEIRLKAGHAEALSELLQILLCGEESASLVFHRFAADPGQDPELVRALEGIAKDEERHEALLQSLRRGLPTPSRDDPLIGAIRHFFKSTADRNIGRHFAGIAALDSVACCMLGALRGRGAPVAADPVAEAVLARIHRDEARHVGISASIAHALLGPATIRDVIREVGHRFVHLLACRADAIECLAVDPDRLFARLREGPRFLLH